MILILFLISAIVRIWYAVQPTVTFWDSAMYVGIGKYMFSGGTIGVWEMFRPPLLPIILGLSWKAGFSPFIAGKILNVALSIGEVWLVYLVGKKISKNTGIFAAIFIALSPIIIAFSMAPFSDVPSTFFTTLAVLCVLDNRFFVAGLSIAAAFLIRFPQGLVIVPILMFLFLDGCASGAGTENMGNIFTRIPRVVAGFVLPVIPYLIVNWFKYHDFLLPIIRANQVVNDPLNAKGRDIFFYAHNLFIQDPFFVLSVLVALPLFGIAARLYKKAQGGAAFAPDSYSMKDQAILLVSLCLVVIGVYFSTSTHMELRYGIAFLPFLAIAAGYGGDYLIMLIPKQRRRTRRYASHATAFVMTASLLTICWIAYTTYWPMFAASPELTAFQHYFEDKPGATVITSSPDMVAYSDIQIVQAIDTWESAVKAYDVSSSNVEYFAVNDCALLCESDQCDAAKKTFLGHLNTEWKKAFVSNVGSCTFEIFTR